MTDLRKPPYSVADLKPNGSKKPVSHPGAQSLGWPLMDLSKAALADLMCDALDLAYGEAFLNDPISRHNMERFAEFAGPRLAARGDRPPKSWSKS